MTEVRCPHCGDIKLSSDSNYYACESCSTMFHTVEKDGKIQAELD